MSSHGYRSLALAVINSAVEDFKDKRSDRKVKSVRRRLRSLSDQEAVKLLRIVNRQVEAGRFLFERTDDITTHWFNVALISRDSLPARMRNRFVLLSRLYESFMAHQRTAA